MFCEPPGLQENTGNRPKMAQDAFKSEPRAVLSRSRAKKRTSKNDPQKHIEQNNEKNSKINQKRVPGNVSGIGSHNSQKVSSHAGKTTIFKTSASLRWVPIGHDPLPPQTPPSVMRINYFWKFFEKLPPALWIQRPSLQKRFPSSADPFRVECVEDPYAILHHPPTHRHSDTLLRH